MQDYDPTSKWVIQYHGDAILRMAGFGNIASWKALQAEPVHPRRLPDGLLEVRRQGRSKPSLFVLEVSSYPYRRLAKQAGDDALLVYLERGVVPDVVALVLHSRGKRPTPHGLIVHSEEGSTSIRVAWKVVELWKVPATDLLAAGDIGLIPWVPLAKIDGPPEPIFRECRDRIENDPDPQHREALRVVTHFLAGLKYNDPGLLRLLGGKKAMVTKFPSPLLQEIADDVTRKATRNAAERHIIQVLRARFGAEPRALKGELKALEDDQLDEFVVLAATCPDLESFRKQLPPRKQKRRA
jgi:hypothetical protein